MQAYKSLCEKKIKQAFPNQSFPLTDDALTEHQTKQQSNETASNLNMQINEMNQLLIKKDQEILQNIRNYDELNKKYNKIVKTPFKNRTSNKNSRQVSPNQSSQFDQNTEIIPTTYNSSHNSLVLNMNELNLEKERILDSLRKETLLNEEQKNYIEILKQTIENTINKLGIGPLLNQQW